MRGHIKPSHLSDSSFFDIIFVFAADFRPSWDTVVDFSVKGMDERLTTCHLCMPNMIV